MALLSLRLPPKGWDVSTLLNRTNAPCWVYLDHNVLDSMLKGRLRPIKRRIDGERVVAVYSNVNLDEIARSAGHEAAFLELLQEIGARYLVSLVDHKFAPTGHAEIRRVNPREAYSSHLRTLEESPKGDFGLGAFLRKFYGGFGDVSYREILAKGNQELLDMLGQEAKRLEDDRDLDSARREQLRTLMTHLRSQVEVTYKTFADSIEADSQQMSARAFEDGTGLHPLHLNNISGPDIVGQIWERFKQAASNPDLDPEIVFGLKEPSWSARPSRKHSPIENVNALYHALNFLGYFRDSSMKEERGFHRSFSDTTHAGMASFCHILLTCDLRLERKARAAYEYLHLGTRVMYLQFRKR
jgi:hypothetical protein